MLFICSNMNYKKIWNNAKVSEIENTPKQTKQTLFFTKKKCQILDFVVIYEILFHMDFWKRK